MSFNCPDDDTSPRLGRVRYPSLANQVGDGTTSVVIIAAELLRRGNELVKNKIHPTTVMNRSARARYAP